MVAIVEAAQDLGRRDGEVARPRNAALDLDKGEVTSRCACLDVVALVVVRHLDRVSIVRTLDLHDGTNSESVTPFGVTNVKWWLNSHLLVEQPGWHDQRAAGDTRLTGRELAFEC